MGIFFDGYGEDMTIGGLEDSVEIVGEPRVAKRIEIRKLKDYEDWHVKHYHVFGGLQYSCHGTLARDEDRFYVQLDKEEKALMGDRSYILPGEFLLVFASDEYFRVE